MFLKDFFPNKTVKGFDLAKSNTIAEDNALHLDCCFQPVGKGQAIIHKEGFRREEDYKYLLDLFGAENLFHLSKKEMYDKIREFNDLLIKKGLELNGTITGEHGVGLHKKKYLLD